MIHIDEVLIIHDYLIETFGGLKGIRDIKLLASAMKRPYSGAFDDEFYPSVTLKAAALIEGIVKNHPFLDGNKRTAYVILRLFLNEHGKDILADEDDKYDMVMRIANSEIEFGEVHTWIENHLVDR